MVAGVHLVATDPLDHRLVQDRLQFAAVDRELREFVATVEAAQVAPDLLAEAAGVDQLVGADSPAVESLAQAAGRQFLDGVRPGVDADAELADVPRLPVALQQIGRTPSREK